jgi:hypothetical protein
MGAVQRVATVSGWSAAVWRMQRAVAASLPPRLLLLPLLLLSLLSVPCLSINIVVPPNDELCFFEELQQGEKMYASFAVQSGGYGDIDVKVALTHGRRADTARCLPSRSCSQSDSLSSPCGLSARCTAWT